MKPGAEANTFRHQYRLYTGCATQVLIKYPLQDKQLLPSPP